MAGVRGPASAWTDGARRLEDDGYSTLLVPDTLWTPSPFLVLAAVAAATTNLRLGTWVIASALRRPAEVVREVKTLQELSAGRVELGIGAGRPGGERDAEALGVEWGSAGARVTQVEATVTAVRGGIDPVPRIVIAGSGDRMLGIAARMADTLALPTPPTADLATLAALAERARVHAGDIELAVQLTGVGDDIPAWLRHQQGLTPDGLREAGSATMLSGDVDRDADALAELREATGISYLTVPGELTPRVGPLVARVSGS
ncbi:TIGR03621 family F420-dependent LLM class oxidoreductase [Microbacterium deminutum]|uniref:TIGR03621 family F420-dependent LLM class oxidoreductase n=1 Tax=Microbacterium deminutum TaxID=344164 RepID=A0ABN2Q5H6_9MICO